MYTYPNFDKEVLRVFERVISQYNLVPKSLSNSNFSELQLVNEKCILRFTYNVGEVGCSFIDPNEKQLEIFPIYSVWQFLFPSDTKTFGVNEFDFEKQLYSLASLIVERFSFVLHGDFSWVNSYKANNTELSKKIEYLINILGADYPITSKFWSGDKSWESDLEKFLSENQVKL